MLQPKCFNASSKEATIRRPGLQLEQPTLLEPIVQQWPLRDLKSYYRGFLEGAWLAICAETYAFRATVDALRVG